MKRLGLCLLAVLVLGGCKEDKESTGGIVYATEDTPGTAPTPAPARDSQEVAIAKCLSSKGAVIYGASWCAYTKKQIESFGDGFQYLHYVECTEQGATCKAKEITGYPTTIIGEVRVVGYRPPEDIGSAAGCAW